MAQYRLEITAITAGEGKSLQGSSAYINGAEAEVISSIHAASAYLSATRFQQLDYSNKSGIRHAEFVGPKKFWENKDQPDRLQFWNEVADYERKNNRRYYSKKSGEPVATLGREHKVNLPHELPFDVNLSLARAYVLEFRKRYGVAGEFAIHDPPQEGDERNIHFHFLHTERAVDDEGNFSKTKASFNLGPRKERKNHVIKMREWWSKRVNRELTKHCIQTDFDHRSYAERGINKIPTKHMGPYMTKLERAGIPTSIGEHNRCIHKLNSLNKKEITNEELTIIKRRSTIARRCGERKLTIDTAIRALQQSIKRVGIIYSKATKLRIYEPETEDRHRRLLQTINDAFITIVRLCFVIESRIRKLRRLQQQRVELSNEGLWRIEERIPESALLHLRAEMIKKHALAVNPRKRQIRR